MHLPVAVIAPLQWLITVFDAIMVFFHDHVIASWGLSIIFLTIVVRAALIPLTLKQYHSMQALQKLQPQIKELQAKYKGDKQRLNQEMMKFYQENKVNPLASCLPLAAQLPVFISLFYMLRHDLRQDICGQTAQPCGVVDPGSAKFLFIPDLTNKATGAVLVTLLILYAGSQLLSGLMMMSQNPDKSQRTMMLILPLVFVPIVIGFPAGVVLYWITTNLWTILQQYIVRRRLGPMRPAVQPAAAEAAGGGGGGGSGGDGSGGRASEPAPAPSGAGGLLARARAAVEGSTATAAPESPVNGRSRSGGAPPPPPRKKKKRSGRRR
jgi:YidC/Oxa1 family membrane protein insertase